MVYKVMASSGDNKHGMEKPLQGWAGPKRADAWITWEVKWWRCISYNLLPLIFSRASCHQWFVFRALTGSAACWKELAVGGGRPGFYYLFYHQLAVSSQALFQGSNFTICEVELILPGKKMNIRLTKDRSRCSHFSQEHYLCNSELE